LGGGKTKQNQKNAAVENFRRNKSKKLERRDFKQLGQLAVG